MHLIILNLILAVVAVANGLQAWKILEDFNNHIDLVLTEVVMPVLSGVGLLCEIMNHITFKNIPVISKLFSLFVLICKVHFCTTADMRHLIDHF